MEAIACQGYMDFVIIFCDRYNRLDGGFELPPTRLNLVYLAPSFSIDSRVFESQNRARLTVAGDNCS